MKFDLISLKANRMLNCLDIVTEDVVVNSNFVFYLLLNLVNSLCMRRSELDQRVSCTTPKRDSWTRMKPVTAVPYGISQKGIDPVPF